MALSGNNHDMSNPALELALPMSEKIPLIIRVFSKQFKDYYFNPSLLPSLNNANNKSSQQRAERRAACVLMGNAMFKHVDLTTFKVGYPNSKTGEFVNFTIKYFVKVTGLSQRRCERAFKDLKAAGIFSVTQVCEEVRPGVVRGRAAVKCLNQKIFRSFSMGDWLSKERKKASKRATEAANIAAKVEDKRKRRQANRNAANVGLAADAMGNKLGLFKAKRNRKAPKPELTEAQKLEYIMSIRSHLTEDEAREELAIISDAL